MTVLVSGATGFLGRSVVRALNDEVVVVLRGRDWEQRARSLGRRTRREVRGLAGDVVRPFWGLSREQRGELHGRVTAVVHLAADTDWAASQERLDHTNVLGTRHAVDVALDLEAPLVSASTLYAAYGYARRIPEMFVEERPVLSAYERSKCRAEWVVETARATRGLQATVARISPLIDEVGNLSARHRVRAPLLRLLRARPWPVVPAAPGARLDIVPADRAAGALVDIVEAGRYDRAVTHASLGEGAPTVAAVAHELSAIRADAGEAPLRIVPVPAQRLIALSLAADRFGRSPWAAMLVGLRYFATASVFETDNPVARDLSLRDLLTVAGGPPEQHLAMPSFYERWIPTS